MPRYYFDTVENGQLASDTIGTDLAGKEEIAKAASRFLAELAQEFLVLNCGEKLSLEIRVRDEAANVVHLSTMVYLARNHDVDWR